MVSKELQKKYLQLQLLKHQTNALVEEKQAVDARIQELAVSVHALNGMERIGKGSEMWSSLGSGAFVRSDIKDTTHVLVGIGAGVVIRETREKSVALLQSRMQELHELDRQLMQEITAFGGEIAKLEPEVQKLVEKEQQ